MDHNIFSERLKTLRNQNNLTQQDIADILEVGRATVAGYETKGKQPGYDKLIMIADYFNVSVDYLIGRSNECKSYESMDVRSYCKFCDIDTEGLSDDEIMCVKNYIEFLKYRKL